VNEASTPVDAGKGAPRRRVDPAYIVVGLALLANGAALVLHIVRGIPLPPLLLILWAAGLLAIVVAFTRANTWVRLGLRRRFLIGVGAGLIATVAYDASKALLSGLDPSPWNPFEATRVFGLVLLGPDAPDQAVRLTGWAFHLSNGATFGMSFAFIFGSRARTSRAWAIALGATWGLFLESFQLSLYPGWLGIPPNAVAEFRQVSFLAHAVFGVCLGLLVRRWMPPEWEESES
jgi:hypothetical protein